MVHCGKEPLATCDRRLQAENRALNSPIKGQKARSNTDRVINSLGTVITNWH